MVCFIVPLGAAIISSLVWRAKKGGPSGWWLNLLLYGGALFGVIDHAWNGEFLLGFQNLMNGTVPFSDAALGFAITGGIFGAWGLSLGMARLSPELGRRMGLVSPDQSP